MELSAGSLIITAGHRVGIGGQNLQLLRQWFVIISVAEWRIPFRIYFHLRFTLAEIETVSTVEFTNWISSHPD